MTNENFFYIFYSLIQGITEFIPISSSGHLNIIELIFVNLEERNFLYETTAHFASLLALFLYLLRNKYFEFSNIKVNFFPIIFATVPAVLVGFIMISLKINIISLKIIGFASIFGGLMLYFSDKKQFQRLKVKSRVLRFFLAGVFQCLAFIPGFSRSASCIIAFRLLGEERRVSSIYSLYLGMPIIAISFLSNFKDLKNMFIDFNLVIIFIVTFISAYITLNLFINFINKISFTPFVIYRILLGLIILSIF
jgi:undecaprenyl-diphosphatase